MTVDYAPEQTQNGTETTKEPKTIRIRIGTGPEWAAPVDVVKELVSRLHRKNPRLVRETLAAIMTGQDAE